MEQVQQLSERRDDVAAAVSALAGIDAVLWQGGSEQLGPLFRQLDDLGRAVEAARVAVLGEAIERGETTTTMARAHTGWIVEWAPPSVSRRWTGSVTGSPPKRSPACGGHC